MDKKFNLIEVFHAAIKWYKPITIITILVLVISYILTHPALEIVKPKYESKSIIYPINPALTDRPYLFEAEKAVDLDLDVYGDKHDVDRLVSIARSNQMATYVINKFNLIDHYDIDTAETEYPYTKTINKFKNHYEAFKNEFRAVEIHVKDKNKGLAAQIANEIPHKIDAVNKQMMTEHRKKIYKALKDKINRLKSNIKSLSDSLDSGSDNTQQTLLKNKRDQHLNQLTKLSNIQDQYEVITSEDFSTLEVMEKAYPAEKPEPTRIYLIIGALLVTLFVLIVTATVIELFIKPNR